MPQLTPPEDKTITSLYVGGVEPGITEKDLRYMYMYMYILLRYMYIQCT